MSDMYANMGSVSLQGGMATEVEPYVSVIGGICIPLILIFTLSEFIAMHRTI